MPLCPAADCDRLPSSSPSRSLTRRLWTRPKWCTPRRLTRTKHPPYLRDAGLLRNAQGTYTRPTRGIWRALCLWNTRHRRVSRPASRSCRLRARVWTAKWIYRITTYGKTRRPNRNSILLTRTTRIPLGVYRGCLMPSQPHIASLMTMDVRRVHLQPFHTKVVSSHGSHVLQRPKRHKHSQICGEKQCEPTRTRIMPVSLICIPACMIHPEVLWAPRPGHGTSITTHLASVK